MLSCNVSCDRLLSRRWDKVLSGVYGCRGCESNACLQLRAIVPRNGTLRVVEDRETMGSSARNESHVNTVCPIYKTSFIAIMSHVQIYVLTYT